ncbi:hypothetical protein A2334_02180 [Candidatus Roizmanbacteria bacterium RIFOXYB2_FULL_38_10]|uniref:Uncharacterized protein n=1 Tax=Candidatus Roizmanbacteria bacterium RIFOXYD1_FULL_38_12 TaxID=1802093 RepID=A0A1F7L044_9BACT|nr:MAG: hypothetical protein A3K47_01785 [Candidatus Roizmanbacteria bacterium RIFOXYA2_FULL_38_14]OGK63510.1 MAG: hypothetical protein A3K27_01785 [Candidatus Roizmanbacteria bacterium RIFOXYA1_FULL_37_12]OGK65356.1 MAG: hypothetical protein A3K38_01785 [Candidatus Roizmanbacteria bacterium RIFOXYB1_FULL_40_23]OGK67929.1 MAG: hypothetical protein A2334_02180 [Candidatus Roizmanbacteria bacterium RIFOXYB2_FULL_38_10]OGK69761.1 MAG: hypothetical protein A3K21_01790 [Candidatus Roizmanbacteria ba
MFLGEGFRHSGPVQDLFANTHRLYFHEQNGDTNFADKHPDLLESLSRLTAVGFLRNEVTEGLRKDVADHVFGCQRLTVAMMDECATGFLATTIRGSDLHEKILHVEGIICDPGFPGLGFHLLKKEVQETRPDFIAFHTQSEKMKRLGLKVADLNIDDAVRLGVFINTGNQLGDVDRGRYGHNCLYGDIEAFAPCAITDVDYARGDAMIFAGPPRPDILQDL